MPILSFLIQQFDLLYDEKNDILTEHNYTSQRQADDVDKHEQTQFFFKMLMPIYL